MKIKVIYDEDCINEYNVNSREEFIQQVIESEDIENNDMVIDDEYIKKYGNIYDELEIRDVVYDTDRNTFIYVRCD